MENISIDELHDRSKSFGDNVLILDVRSAEEYASGHIVGSQNTSHEEVNGIVAYSLFQMPVKQADRLKIYNKALKLKGELHFAVEGLKITCQSEIDRIETIWLVKQTLPKCYKYME